MNRSLNHVTQSLSHRISCRFLHFEDKLEGHGCKKCVLISLFFVKLIQKILVILAGGIKKAVAAVQSHNKMPKPSKDKKNYTMYNETLYEVERVVQIKWVKNRQYCYIKWKGYDERFNTWQPKEHITFCYNYVNPEEKEDDPEYRETPILKTPNNKHQYQTRGKIKPMKALCDTEEKEKEDSTRLEDVSELMQSHQSWRPYCGRSESSALAIKELKEGKEHSDLKETAKQPKQHKQHKQPKQPRQHKELREPKVKREEEDRPRPSRGMQQQKNSWKLPRETLISRILWLNYEQSNEKRIGKVEMQDGKIAYMYEDILKARYPEKVIEFYEQEIRQRAKKKE